MFREVKMLVDSVVTSLFVICQIHLECGLEIIISSIKFEFFFGKRTTLRYDASAVVNTKTHKRQPTAVACYPAAPPYGIAPPQIALRFPGMTVR